MDNRRVVEVVAKAMQNRDVETVARYADPDIVVTYPQSGEVIRGADNYLAMLANYPSGVPEAEVSEPTGSTETVQVIRPLPFGPSSVTVIGGGDTFVLEAVADYRDAGIFHIVSIIKVRDGKVIEETSYFGTPFDPPEWRRPFVEG